MPAIFVIFILKQPFTDAKLHYCNGAKDVFKLIDFKLGDYMLMIFRLEIIRLNMTEHCCVIC